MGNTPYIPLSDTAWVFEDRLFVVGNGASPLSLSDAMVILKNGNTGIGTSNPAAKLHVFGQIKIDHGVAQDGYVLTLSLIHI